jgi:putative ABC transport system permease protein
MWRDEFAYHIELHRAYFVGSVLLVLIVGGVTVTYQTVKTAIINPAKVLRSE